MEATVDPPSPGSRLDADHPKNGVLIPCLITDLTPENAYWLSGEDQHGEIVLTYAGRFYYWPVSSLEEEACGMFYADRDRGRACLVIAAHAKLITGGVFYGGSGWVRPDLHGRKLMQLVAKLGRAYALAPWPVDFGISLVTPRLVEKGLAWGYG